MYSPDKCIVLPNFCLQIAKTGYASAIANAHGSRERAFV